VRIENCSIAKTPLIPIYSERFSATAMVRFFFSWNLLILLPEIVAKYREEYTLHNL
jgi:hypothetical protein